MHSPEFTTRRPVAQTVPSAGVHNHVDTSHLAAMDARARHVARCVAAIHIPHPEPDEGDRVLILRARRLPQEGGVERGLDTTHGLNRARAGTSLNLAQICFGQSAVLSYWEKYFMLIVGAYTIIQTWVSICGRGMVRTINS